MDLETLLTLYLLHYFTKNKLRGKLSPLERKRTYARLEKLEQMADKVGEEFDAFLEEGKC